MPKMKRLFPAVFATVVLLLAGAILATDNPIADYVQQRYLSLRYRVAELAPQPTPPPFMPTPLDISDTFAIQPVSPSTALFSPILPSAQMNVIPTPAPASSPTPAPTPTNVPPMPTPSVNLASIQPSVLISGVEHEYQGWNNCGPTTLKMLLN